MSSTSSFESIFCCCEIEIKFKLIARKMFRVRRLKEISRVVYNVIREVPVSKNPKNVQFPKNSIINIPAPAKVVTFSIIYGLSLFSSSSSNLKYALSQADIFFEENKASEACKILEPFKNEKNDEVLWRLSKALYTLSKDVADDKKKKEMIFQAYDYINQALSLNEKNYAVHKWMSILIDATSAYNGIKAKITQAHVMKQHMMRAVELNPKDATVLYLLGSWCFEVANMPWYQRKIASTVFATPPTSSFEEALEYFLKAESADPCFYSMNFLMLGKTYVKLNNIDKAVHYLKLARDYPQKTSDDKKASEEAESILKKLQ
ncbi:hypothetical protein J437_LFUL002736 [Ladona fulva]|uniref:Regulator of microtubule dynamics protein 1 n=1 Tax=Ladona fulva TaxID=123851 RepID=A0A8K0NYD7_LADFU|nr:hypothetical protein J437_LFUL002736 [Ladona fulva]